MLEDHQAGRGSGPGWVVESRPDLFTGLPGWDADMAGWRAARPSGADETPGRVVEVVSRRVRERLRFGFTDVDDPVEYGLRGGGLSLRPDEFLDCLNRRSAYVACRPVATVDRAAAYRAGL